MDSGNKYMVEFQIPTPLPEELESMIPEQRVAVHDLFMEEKLLTYTLAMDRHKLWAIFIAEDESELEELIHRMPMSQYLHYDYGQIMFHETVQYIPTMSLN